MNRSPHWKLSLAAMSAAMLLAACGGAPEDISTGQSAQSSPSTGTISAASYPEYDPAYHCIVSGPYDVVCNNGVGMNTYWSSDVGYYIERDVCDRFGGGLVCPYW